MYTTYPNQRVLVGSEFAECDSENLYMKLNKEALENAFAMFANNPSSLKLFLYFSSNQEYYSEAISSKKITEYCHMSRPTFLKAFDDLIEKGFLVQTGNKNEYKFIQYP